MNKLSSVGRGQGTKESLRIAEIEVKIYEQQMVVPRSPEEIMDYALSLSGGTDVRAETAQRLLSQHQALLMEKGFWNQETQENLAAARKRLVEYCDKEITNEGIRVF